MTAKLKLKIPLKIFFDRVSLVLAGLQSSVPGWPRSYRDPPASDSRGLELKVHATMSVLNFYSSFCIKDLKILPCSQILSITSFFLAIVYP